MANLRRSQATRAALLAGAFFSFGLAANLGGCGGKVVIDQGEGGAGGNGSHSTSSNSSTSGSTGSFTGSSSSGVDPPPPCVRCGDYFPKAGDPSALCGDSFMIYQGLHACLCAQSCIPQCQENICSGQGPSDACYACAKGKCEKPFTECLNDF